MDKFRLAGFALLEQVNIKSGWKRSVIQYTGGKKSEQRLAQKKTNRRANQCTWVIRSSLGSLSIVMVQRWLPWVPEVATPLYNGLTDKPYFRPKRNSEIIGHSR